MRHISNLNQTLLHLAKIFQWFLKWFSPPPGIDPGTRGERQWSWPQPWPRQDLRGWQCFWRRENYLFNLCMSVTESLMAHQTSVFSGNAEPIIYLLSTLSWNLGSWIYWDLIDSLTFNTFAGTYEPSDIPMPWVIRNSLQVGPTWIASRPNIM